MEEAIAPAELTSDRQRELAHSWLVGKCSRVIFSHLLCSGPDRIIDRRELVVPVDYTDPEVVTSLAESDQE